MVFPGSRFPCFGLPGSRFPYSGRPGSRFPCSGLQGCRFPCSGLPGSRFPGSRVPGFSCSRTENRFRKHNAGATFRSFANGSTPFLIGEQRLGKLPGSPSSSFPLHSHHTSSQSICQQQWRNVQHCDQRLALRFVAEQSSIA